jgi:hypothetical protein
LKNTCSPSALKNLLPVIERTEIALTNEMTVKRKTINKFELRENIWGQRNVGVAKKNDENCKKEEGVVGIEGQRVLPRGGRFKGWQKKTAVSG